MSRLVAIAAGMESAGAAITGQHLPTMDRLGEKRIVYLRQEVLPRDRILKEQNPNRFETRTNCNFHRKDDLSHPSNHIMKTQDKWARYAGLTLSLLMSAKPSEVSK